MIPVKDAAAIEVMKRAGALLARIAQFIRKNIIAGITTAELDRIAAKEFKKHGVTSAFLGYRGFPANICVSVNEEVVHGIPGERLIQDGDIVSIDLGITMDGYCSDMAFTHPVGRIQPQMGKLLEVTQESLRRGIKQAKAHNRIFDISCAIQAHVEKNGFSVVRDFVGHGIGKQLHEEPQIPNFGQAHTGEEIKEGMVFAIEPMVNVGGWQIEILENGWTAVAKDRKPSCHFEHTVAVAKDGPHILTQ